MKKGLIAKHYAKALLTYASKQGVEEAVYHNTVSLTHNFAEYPKLMTPMSSSMLSATEKEKVLITATGQDISPEFIRFIKLVIENNREEFMPDICTAYQRLYREIKGILLIEITSAVEMTNSIKERIVTKIADSTGLKIEARTKVNRELIGGYTILWDTYQWDGSVKTALKRIKKELIDINFQK